MNIQTITKLLIDAGIENNEAKKELSMLLEYFCNYTEKDRLMGKELSENDLSLIHEKALYRKKKKNPIQYIIGEAYFMGEYFKVTPDVLIPRDETEILVRKAIDIINENDFKDVLDIGTGSGCIAITLAKELKDAKITALDISKKALAIAKKNIKLNKVLIKLKKVDILNTPIKENYDVIISNPPYIALNEKVDPATKFEPQQALFANDNGLEYYKCIINNLKNIDFKICAFEIGMTQKEALCNYINNTLSNVKIDCQKDYNNKDRYLFIINE